MSADVSTRHLVDDPDYLADIRDVAAMGYGHPQTIRQRIRAGVLPAVKVGGKYKVRVGDLPRPSAAPAGRPEQEDLDAIAEAVVKGFPPLTADQKAALGRLLSSRLQASAA